MALHQPTERTLDGALREIAALDPDRVWLRADTDSYTFAEASWTVARYARGLRALGLRPGDRAAMLLDNSLDYVLLALAVTSVGAIFVPINSGYKGRFLAHVLGQTQSTIVFADPKYRDAIQAVIGELPDLHAVGWTETAPALDGLENFRVADLDGPAWAEHSTTTWASPASIVYTSGTTGLSKGAVMSHNSWFDSVLSLTGPRDVRPDDAFYLCAPLFHAGSWLTSILPGLMLGLPVGVDPGFTVSRFLDRIHFYGATQIVTLGATHMWLWDQPATSADAETSARVWCPSPLPATLHEPFKERFGLEHIWGLYGQTEAMVIASTRTTMPYKPGTCGVARPEVELAIVDDDDRVLPPNAHGELVVRPRAPKTIMDGYWANPEATLQVFRNLWYHTGDIARIDEDGELFFVDRKDDYLRVGGENVSSFEVESVLTDHPAVKEAAAYGVVVDPNTPGLEDELMVAVVLTDDVEAEPAALAEYAAIHLPKFAVPRHIVLLADLPRTPLGRVQKHVLRSQGLTSETWSRTGR